MDVAALLLTGGASRRMGCDKAGLAGPDGAPMGRRTAQLLATVAACALEVGPGRSGLEAVRDTWPGAGPLAAVATGAAALRQRGWRGAVLVIATDLPCLDAAFLRWLAGHRFPGSVIPLVAGRPQWLCARYDADSIGAAATLVADGERRMRVLTIGRRAHLAPWHEWAATGSPALAPMDVDTPDELAALTALATVAGGRARGSSA